jgi:hypothetical protein
VVAERAARRGGGIRGAPGKRTLAEADAYRTRTATISTSTATLFRKLIRTSG